jgi:subtilisin family serine protease
MKKATFKINPKASVTFNSVVERRKQHLSPNFAVKAAGFGGEDTERIHETDLISVLFEAKHELAPNQIANDLDKAEKMEHLGGSIWSAKVGEHSAQKLLDEKTVTRIQSKKLSKPHLDKILPEISLVSATGARQVEEDGQGVLIGVIDTGFDLSHPAFRDSLGHLRVEALLDQIGNSSDREYSNDQLEAGWATGGARPGADTNGHGTHVASIAGGTKFLDYEGVAPGARFLLVRTDFINTDTAIKWIFDKATALGKPCVVNMSLGHHGGAHDGTDVEERLHRTLTAGGKIIVVSAGNEREDSLHIGKRFNVGENQEVIFDIKRQQDGAPNASIALWHNEKDKFDVSLITPGGRILHLPTMNQGISDDSSVLDIDITRRRYIWSNAHQIEFLLGFKSQNARDQDLENWRLRIDCKSANVGRIDGWFSNSGYGSFKSHPIVENHRTVGICATGDGCLAVASHIARTKWDTDLGPAENSILVAGRSSPFSSLGPTRDGRWKPDISAPGQYVTAALADQSVSSRWEERASVYQRMLTIEGTSMSAPVITGIIALMLQKKPALTLGEARTILRETARHDDHTGPENWNPAYGFGKVDVAAALAKLP